jgi:UDP-N-acetylglucosamine 2-epimerase (non-hydrolysing)
MRELSNRGVQYRWIDSGQHRNFTSRQQGLLDDREPDISLSSVLEDVASFRRGFAWSGRLLLRWLFRPKWIRETVFGGQDGVCVIHGDTFSALLGALFARRVGIAVAHLESGLRSGSYLNPFPEELIRVLCIRMSQLLLAPDEHAVKNLHKLKAKGKIVNTAGNTITDALRLHAAQSVAANQKNEPYVLATCHRLETIRSKSRLSTVIDALNLVAGSRRVLFVQHPPTKRSMEKFGLYNKLSDSIEVLPLQDYFGFIDLIRNAEFLMADGGTIQEECAALGTPLLILRSRSERLDGIGTSAMFAEFRLENVKKFLEKLPALRSTNTAMDGVSPSMIVTDELMKFDPPESLSDVAG